MSSRAASAASRVAGAHGYDPSEPVVLQRLYHTVVWLRPHDVVAKVGTSEEAFPALRREHAIGVALAASGAPIAPPVPDIEPAIDEETGSLVTLWTRLEHDPRRELPARDLGRSLRLLHEHLARYEGPVPNFRDALTRSRAALADDGMMRALSHGDRSILRDAFDRLRAELEERRFAERLIHGEPHRDNVLATAAGLRWIDFEEVSVGPLEWDLASLPSGAEAVFPEVDRDLLGLLRTLNSARVATWCWACADIDRKSDV